MPLGKSYEWPTLGLLLASAMAWAGVIWFYSDWGGWIVCPLAAVLVTLQSSLQHEVLHGHPTKSAKLNEALVYCSFGLFIPYQRFKALHLRHHNDDRLTDPYDDPEAFYLAWGDWQKLPKAIQAVLTLNNTLAGRLLIGPAVSLIGFYGSELRLLKSGDKSVRRAWGHHILGLVPVVLFVTLVGGMPLWLYGLGVAYPGMSLLMLRTYAEHRAHEDTEARSVIVEFCPIFSLLFLNNNLHIVHHSFPRAPWYALPGLYRSAREEWQARNQGYVFKSYLEMAKIYLFKSKEPVPHPLVRREVTDAARSAS
ncbi:fatty acid desaturase [Roseibium sp.]|uniref:fatty acid desaturase n=1 Tax=Roseibium sp. TaxID=1936156 RepID=UPI003B52CF59